MVTTQRLCKVALDVSLSTQDQTISVIELRDFIQLQITSHGISSCSYLKPNIMSYCAHRSNLKYTSQVFRYSRRVTSNRCRAYIQRQHGYPDYVYKKGLLIGCCPEGAIPSLYMNGFKELVLTTSSSDIFSHSLILGLYCYGSDMPRSIGGTSWRIGYPQQQCRRPLYLLKEFPATWNSVSPFEIPEDTMPQWLSSLLSQVVTST